MPAPLLAPTPIMPCPQHCLNRQKRYINQVFYLRAKTIHYPDSYKRHIKVQEREPYLRWTQPRARAVDPFSVEMGDEIVSETNDRVWSKKTRK